MALTPAERQRRRRERLKKEGTSRRDWILEPDELRMLGEICVLRRPGRVPYSENEVIGLLIRKNYKELQKQLSTTCPRCGQKMPVSECIFDKSEGKKKVRIRSKIALSNSFAKVWAASTL